MATGCQPNFSRTAEDAEAGQSPAVADVPSALRPTVSIGMPVYNGEKYLREAIESILNQSFRDFELIISDNASTDATGPICQEYAERDRRIRYVRQPRNFGVVDNLDYVLATALGEYFLWAADDDMRPAHALEALVAAFDGRPDVVLSHGAVLIEHKSHDGLIELSNELDGTDSDSPARRILAFTRGLRHNSISYGLFRRTAIAEGVPRDVLVPDYIIVLKMCLSGRIVHVKGPFIIYREKPYRAVGETMWGLASLRGINPFNVDLRRRKHCWSTLGSGCLLIARSRQLSLASRAATIAAFASSFALRYGPQLIFEAIFQVLWLVGRLARIPSKLRAIIRRPAARAS